MEIVLTEMQKSALLEIGNIGAGHAAIALSQLMDKKIMITVPSIEILKLLELDKILPDTDKKYIHIYLMMLGDMRGIISFVLEYDTALRLYDAIKNLPAGKTRDLGGLEQSALEEIGNILSSSYLNAVSKITGFSLVVSVPECLIGSTGGENRGIFQRQGIAADNINNVICIKTVFIEEAAKIDGYLIFAPTDTAIGKIIKSLGV